MLIIEKQLNQTLLSYEQCCHFADICGFSGDFIPLFYDIETTGLARKTTQLYLIGCVWSENNQWLMKQWLAESLEEEPNVLRAFTDFSKHFTHTIQFNGNRFDAPYVRERCSIYGLISPIDTLPALDLYQFVKPIKLLLQLNHLKQSDVENFLGVEERKYPDGKTCITHYRNFINSPKEHDLKYILGHNEEDLYGMLRVYSILAYQSLLNGYWSHTGTDLIDNELLFHLKLADPLPQRISGGLPGIYLRADHDQLKLLVKIQNGRLQQFYTNYKEYVYLPSEDHAIPKSLGSYIDKSLKEPATLLTCYTWFDFTEQFLNDNSMQLQYLKHAVPYILEVLCAKK